MDILLIDPPFTSLRGVSVDCGYNVGLTSLAAYLRRGGIETGIIMGDIFMGLPPFDAWSADQEDGQTASGSEQLAKSWDSYEATVKDNNHYIWQRLKDEVRKYNPMAVGITYLSPVKPVVDKLTSLIKEVNPDIKIIVGASHPTFRPEEVMRNPNINFIVRGEGEIPLLALMKELKKDTPKWETVPGIYYRDSDNRLKNTPRPDLISNLDELPFIARDLVLNCDYDLYPVHDISTARGCPYTCSFCADRGLWGGKVRRRSLDSVLEEMKFLKDTYTIRSVDFTDGTFTYDRKYVVDFCKRLISLDLGIMWRCTARYDNVDDELIKLMKRSNCVGLFFGLESGSERMLKAIDKKITVEQIISVNKMVYDSGIYTINSVIMGFPDETEEDMQETLKIMREIHTDSFDVNNYTPLPGTPLYDALSDDEKDKIDYLKLGLKSYRNFFSKRVSRETLNKYLSDAHAIEDEVFKSTLARYKASMNQSQ
jgi:anaerobic magnesium-protoporphyrin IX monomethyl ester cyclase